MVADATALVRELVRVFERGAWRHEWVSAVERAKALALDHPEAVELLAGECIRRRVDGRTILDAALSWLPMNRWPALVALAVPAMREDIGNTAAVAVVEYASLQRPAAVHPHLEQLFQLPYYYDNETSCGRSSSRRRSVRFRCER
jgi:hypothetical protein